VALTELEEPEGEPEDVVEDAPDTLIEVEVTFGSAVEVEVPFEGLESVEFPFPVPIPSCLIFNP